MRLPGVTPFALVAALACSRAAASTVTLSSATMLSAPVAVVNEYFTMSFAVTNTSSVSVQLQSPSIQSPYSNVGWTGDTRGGQLVAPGATVTFTIAVLAQAAGTYTFTWGVSASEYGGSGVGSTSRALTVTVVTQALAARYGRPIAKGKMEIRNNIIRSASQNTSAGSPSSALIIVHGDPGGHVEFGVYAASGRGLGSPRFMPTFESGGGGGFLELDSEGYGAVSFEGQMNDGTYLQPGVYWMIVSGAAQDRKKMLVLTDIQ